MKSKLTRKTKRAICIYVIVLLILYVVVEILPKVTDIFETTQILEPGNLTLSYETTGYLIKDEQVGIAKETGKVETLVETGTAVKKGHKVVAVKATGEKEGETPRFSDYTERLKGYEGLTEDYKAPISGVFSLSIDGYEDYFTPEKMEKIKKTTVEGLSFKTADLKRDSVIKGEPIYKISGDDLWYILCWVDEETAKIYEEGKKVSIELPNGTVNAKIYKVQKDSAEGDYRVIFSLNVYYEQFAESRAEDMTVVISDNYGLLIKNQCIIEKDGEKGVYVKNKNGNYNFKKIKVIASDEKESVIEDATYVDAEGNQVYTVDVYDEVLKHPESALEKELEQEAEEKKLESQGQEKEN